VRRRALTALALVPALGLLAACGDSHKHARSPSPPAAPARVAPHLVWVHVIVNDGDLGKPVLKALVRVAGHSVRTDRNGIARLQLARPRRLVVRVEKRGYDPYEQPLQFRHQPRVGVRIYRSKLQWTMYGASPQRTQFHPDIGVRPPFRRVIWSADSGGLMEFPAVVSDGVAFTSNYHGGVRAFSMRNGTRIWRRETTGHLASSPAVVGKELVVHGMDGYVWVLSRYNGRPRWRFSVGAPIESSPVVVRGVDYFGSWNGTVYALDLYTHKLLWTYRSGYKITSSASFYRGTIYIGDYSGRLLALSARTGRLRWSGSVNGRIYGTPAVAQGRVFAPSSDGNSLTAFSTGGHRLWSIGTGSYVYASPAVWAGRVYFGSYNGTLYCLSARTGGVLWRFSTAGSIGGAATVVDGIVYVSNRQHRIYGLNARTGRPVFRFPDGAFVPVSGNGRRLLLHGFSRIYAVETRHRR
jgi:outer membrane protein assembly factor BamB